MTPCNKEENSVISKETADKLQRATAEYRQAEEHLTQVREATTASTFVPEAADDYILKREAWEEAFTAAQAERTAG
jgi:glutamine synthetase adenylyltransferase